MKSSEEIRKLMHENGVELYITPARRNQPKKITEGQIRAMLDNNMDKIDDAQKTKNFSEIINFNN